MSVSDDVCETNVDDEPMMISSAVDFRELRCLRNKIHINLFITFWLSNSCWIVSAIIQVRKRRDPRRAVHIIYAKTFDKDNYLG